MSRFRLFTACLPLIALCLLTGCPQATQPTAPPAKPAETKVESPAEKAESSQTAQQPQEQKNSAKHAGIVDIVGEKSFLKFIEETPIAVIDFSAQWCGPCQKFVPELEKLAATHKDKGVKIGRVDVDNNRPIAQTYNVRGIPDIRIFVKGKVVDTIVGFDPPKLRKAIEKAIANFDKPVVDYSKTPLEDELWPSGK